MNKEQNIDDILKQLKNSYEKGSADEQVSGADMQADKSNTVSQAELHEMLKNRFMSDNSVGSTAEKSSEYVIDDDFLADAALEEDTFKEADEAVLEEAAETYTEEQKADAAEEAQPFEENEDNEPFYIKETYPLNDEGDFDIDGSAGYMLFSEESLPDEAVEEDEEDGIFVENEDGEIIFVSTDTGEVVDDELSKSTDISEDDGEELTLDTLDDAMEAFSEEEKDEEDFFSGEDGQLALFEFSDEQEEDFDTDDRSNYFFEDDTQIVMDFGDTEQAELEENSDDSINEIDDAVLGIMLEVGDIDAAENHIAAERINNYISNTKNSDAEDIDASYAFAFDGAEFEEESQADDVRESYRKEKTFTLLRVLGCGFFAFLLVLYELLPFFELNTGFLPSYDENAIAYLLIGMQLMICSAAFAWRELFRGLKKAFSLKADRWSALSLVVVGAAVYDLLLMIISPETVYFMFGTLTSVYILFALLTEYFEVLREIKCFDIYSSDKKKFTFNTEGGANSSADKMYRGGLPYDKNVFEPCEIDFPKGYFKAANTALGKSSSAIYMVTPIILLSTVALIVSVIMKNTIDISMAYFMITLAALCPISLFAARTLPMCRTASRLYQREIAIAGEGMAQKYAKCDYLIFSDLHLFKKANASDCGIVILDENNTKKIIEYLGALYSAIGGPMKDVFTLPSGNPHTVKIRRIARNGVEAMIDRSQNVTLGDRTFLQRYGISFPSDDTKDGDGILLFAVNGKPSAKLCIRYKCEPLFEMLILKMAENGVRCAIETFDPVINSAFASKILKNKNLPVNVIHKNANDYYADKSSPSNENTGIVVSASRFKLIEGVIWCKRLGKISRALTVLSWVVFGIVTAILGVLLALGSTAFLNQYTVLLIQALSIIPSFAAMGIYLPSKKYFLK